MSELVVRHEFPGWSSFCYRVPRKAPEGFERMPRFRVVPHESLVGVPKIRALESSQEGCGRVPTGQVVIF